MPINTQLDFKRNCRYEKAEVMIRALDILAKPSTRMEIRDKAIQLGCSITRANAYAILQALDVQGIIDKRGRNRGELQHRNLIHVYSLTARGHMVSIAQSGYIIPEGATRKEDNRRAEDEKRARVRAAFMTLTHDRTSGYAKHK